MLSRRLPLEKIDKSSGQLVYDEMDALSGRVRDKIIKEQKLKQSGSQEDGGQQQSFFYSEQPTKQSQSESKPMVRYEQRILDPDSKKQIEVKGRAVNQSLNSVNFNSSEQSFFVSPDSQ